MATGINILCYRLKTLANGEHPLMIRICKDGKKKYIGLGISVHPQFWDFEKNKPTRNCPNKEAIERLIAVKTTEYNALIVDMTAEKVELNPQAKVSFQELFDDYVKIKESPFTISLDCPHHKLATIESINPLIKEAYDKLGKDEVIRLKYNQTNIRRELLKRLETPTENKIAKAINGCLSHHIAIPNAVIKERIQGIYDTLDIKRTAKATDLDF